VVIVVQITIVHLIHVDAVEVFTVLVQLVRLEKYHPVARGIYLNVLVVHLVNIILVIIVIHVLLVNISHIHHKQVVIIARVVNTLCLAQIPALIVLVESILEHNRTRVVSVLPESIIVLQVVVVVLHVRWEHILRVDIYHVQNVIVVIISL